MEIICRAPRTEEEWNAYYSVRYDVLRKPWNQPKGSERDELDVDSIHASAWFGDQIAGVARAHFEGEKAIVRLVAVLPAYQSKGVGLKLMHFLEDKIKQNRGQLIELQARENALNFYLKLGYESIERTHLLYGTIQHYLMRKFI